jgi:hypothetical protein
MWGYGLDRTGSRQGQVASTCECGNETSGSKNQAGGRASHDSYFHHMPKYTELRK